MSRIFKTLALTPILFLAFGSAWAQTAKVILDTKIDYGAGTAPKIDFNVQGQSQPETVSNKIQSNLMFYAFAMNQIEDGQRNNLLNQTQSIVTRVATESGLQRPDILKGNPILNLAKGETKGQGYDLVLSNHPGQGNMLDVKAVGTNATLLGPSVFYLFQNSIKTLPDSGLRLMVLALGGMNKWYREMGKASDPNSLSQAPAYGLNLAVDIISKLSGQKI